MLDRKTTILFKHEDLEGTNSVPVAADGIQVYEQSLTEGPYEIPDRRPSGSSLSRGIQPPGRGQRQVTFETDFKGSGSTSTAPPWGKVLRSCGIREFDKHKISAWSAGITGAFQVGELVRVGAGGSGRRGIALNPASGSGALYLGWFEGLPPISTSVLTGESTGATGTVDTVVTEGKVYRTDSERLLTITHVTNASAWTGGDGNPPTVGNVLLISRAGAIIGAMQFVGKTTTAAGAAVETSSEFSLQWGEVIAGDTMTTPGGASEPVITVTATRTPSATIAHHWDGFLRYLIGSRGSFELAGNAGEHMAFNCSFLGLPGVHGDAFAPTGIVYPTTVTPRLIAANVGFGVVTAFLRLPIRRVALNLGGQTVPKPDANATSGDRYVHFVDRKPQLVVSVDKLGKTAFDTIGYLQSAQDNRFGCTLGTSPGNIMVIACNQLQLTNIANGNVDGISTEDLTFEPRQVNVAGDDEFFLAQL